MKKLLTIVTALVITAASAIAFVPARAHAATPCNERVFSTSRNSRSVCVEYIQKMLNTLDSAGLATDHRFGRLTKAAVVARQTQFKTVDRYTLVDGIVGPQTWSKLCALRANYPTVATQAGCDNPPKKCKPRTFSMRTNAYDQTCVGLIKQMVNLVYTPASLSTSGPYDSTTKTAVANWQRELKKSNSRMMVDGIVGPQTWGALCTTPSTSTTLTELRKMAGC